jgi:hypothetical protein
MHRRVAAFVLFGLVLLLGLLGCSARQPRNSDAGAPLEIPSARPTSGSSAASGEETVVQRRTPSQEELLAASGANLGGRDGLTSGGPPPDGIPAIDRPRFVSVPDVNWLGDSEPVGVLTEGAVVRAYPLQILMWHEIVNDVVDGRAVTVTYCPLCNSVLAFDRSLNGQQLSFGTSGMLWRSDLVMYDRQTLSLWTQMEGKAIYGQMVGQQLRFLPVNFVSWADFKNTYPKGQVLSRETGYTRSYGLNPYEGYDSSSRPFLYSGTTDQRLPALERVLGLSGTTDTKPRAWAYSYLAQTRVIQLPDAVIIFFPGMSSATDSGRISEGRDVGATGAFSPVLNGRQLTFEWTGTAMQDKDTGSTWDVFGRGVSGPMTGRQLTPLVKYDVFWFAWSAFFPETELVASK